MRVLSQRNVVCFGLGAAILIGLVTARQARAADAEFMSLLADARQEFVDGQSPVKSEKPQLCPFMQAIETGAMPEGDATILAWPIPPLFIPPDGPTNPMGVARGIQPGRVAWDWDPTACSWDAACSNGAGTWYTGNYYWQPSNLDQTKVDEMVANCLKWVTGEKTTAQAWNALFADFNMEHGLGSNGYVNGEGVTIKPNLVNCWSWAGSPYGDKPNEYNRAMTSPAVLLALLRQLVNVAGVPQSDIYIYCDHIYSDFLWNITHAEFSSVHYCDRNGEYGREDKSADSAHPFLMSDGYQTKTLPTCLTDPKYLIDCPALKSHEDSAQNMGSNSYAELPTLCFKNHFGSLEPGGAGDFHPALETARGYGNYDILPDLMEHEMIGGKTLLCVIDGTYGGLNEWDSVPERWRMTPFGTNWPASILMSQDPCAIDSVGLDFLRQEKQLQGDPYRGYTDNFLHEASQITNPPSGTVYDPDTNGPPTKSLGVHEHWIDPYAKKYTRNLRTGAGIELFSYEPLAGDFDANTPQVLPNFSVYLTPDTMSHNSIGQGIHYWWDTDGNGTWDQQGVDLVATATYASASGPVDIRMLASNEWGETVLYVGTAVVDVIPAVAAGFSATPLSGQAPLQVSFTDESANTPQYWFWSFGGSSSTQQNPVITFDAQGTYTVTLVASNALGAAGWSSDTEQKVNYIEVVPEPAAAIMIALAAAACARRRG